MNLTTILSALLFNGKLESFCANSPEKKGIMKLYIDIYVLEHNPNFIFNYLQ